MTRKLEIKRVWDRYELWGVWKEGRNPSCMIIVAPESSDGDTDALIQVMEEVAKYFSEEPEDEYDHL